MTNGFALQCARACDFAPHRSTAREDSPATPPLPPRLVHCARVRLSCARPIAQEIKKHLDDKWRPHWHCIIGKNFGCYATHESKKCVYFYFKDIAIMLFKT